MYPRRGGTKISAGEGGGLRALSVPQDRPSGRSKPSIPSPVAPDVPEGGPGLIVDEPGTCPVDPEFMHDNYYNCIPKDFSANTGRSRTHKQTKGDDDRYHWDGGCEWKAW